MSEPPRYDPQLHQQRMQYQGPYTETPEQPAPQQHYPPQGQFPPAGPYGTPAPQPPKHRITRWGKWLLAGLGGFIGLIVVIGVIAAIASPQKNTPPSAAPASPAATFSTSYPVGTTAPAATTPAAPAMTVSQQQAVDSAQGYLQMGTGFSYRGLLDQLTSSSGEGFPVADAKFAINYLHPDWYQQAVESARGYIRMGGFSHDSLLQQLTSSSGEGFTEKQAEYAVKAVGL